MRITALMRYANPPAGGAEKSLLNLLGLLRDDHEIQVISLGYQDQRTEYNGICIEEIAFRNRITNGPTTLREFHKWHHIKRMSDGLQEKIRNHSPDLIISQHELSLIVPNYKKSVNGNVKWIYMVNGLEFTSKQEPSSQVDANIRKSLGWMLYGVNQNLIAVADKVFFPSEYLRAKYPKDSSGKYETFSPFISLRPFFSGTNDPKGSILHIKGTKAKGIELTLGLAKGFPHEDFVICGMVENQYRDIINTLSNVTHIGYQENMAEVYAKSRLLLVPTLNGETFSISAVEAQASGLNVLVNSGGIPAPKSSYVNSVQLSDWKEAFILGGNRLRRIDLKSYDYKEQYERLAKLIQQLI